MCKLLYGPKSQSSLLVLTSAYRGSGITSGLTLAHTGHTDASSHALSSSTCLRATSCVSSTARLVLLSTSKNRPTQRTSPRRHIFVNRVLNCGVVVPPARAHANGMLDVCVVAALRDCCCPLNWPMEKDSGTSSAS